MSWMFSTFSCMYYNDIYTFTIWLCDRTIWEKRDLAAGWRYYSHLQVGILDYTKLYARFEVLLVDPQ